MRILEVITPSRIGGAETHLATITRALLRRLDDVTVFCPQGRPLVAYLEERDITPVTWRTWGKFDLGTLFGLIRLIKTRRIDVLHAHLSTAAFLGSLAARMAGIPCVATVHGFTSAGFYARATVIVAVSEAVKAHLVAQGIPAERIVVVYNGIPVDQYHPQPLATAKAACGWSPALRYVGIFGRLSPEKGQEIALRAWPTVVVHDPAARLVLVGDGKQREAWQALAQELGVTDRVIFYGFTPDPRPVMAACDVVLVPSLKEGLGLAAIEGMALARPVVATQTGGLPEVVEDGVTGLLVPPGDTARLAEAILQVLGDPGQADQMGQAGRLRAQEKFDLSQQINQLHQVLAVTA